MKVTQVSIRPTEASEAAGRPSLTPEMLAASGARYSRNNEGLQSILDKIDPKDLDKSVDEIFRMIDYGHQSIADMVPVSMFIDGISIWLAYYVWTLCPTAGGQESSTRYIKLSVDELLPPQELGIPQALHEQWKEDMASCFWAYGQALSTWESLAEHDKGLARIPQHLTNDPSKKSQKQIERMKRNYGFDRARYFLPISAATNMMLIMSARNWTQLCQHLLSHLLPEATRLGQAIYAELKLCAPRMLRHATLKLSMQGGIQDEFQRTREQARREPSNYLQPESKTCVSPPTPMLDVMVPPGKNNFSKDLSCHENRYAWIGNGLRRMSVRFGWEAVAMAEIRDLNRHRTGTKYTPLIPKGFYFAQDQLPASGIDEQSDLSSLSEIGKKISMNAVDHLTQGEPWYVYWTLLGTQYAFEHTTTADKFIYEAELRTGTGAHFRYAQHLHDILSLWYTKFPETKSMILEGSAEPE